MFFPLYHTACFCPLPSREAPAPGSHRSSKRGGLPGRTPNCNGVMKEKGDDEECQVSVRREGAGSVLITQLENGQ